MDRLIQLRSTGPRTCSCPTCANGRRMRAIRGRAGTEADKVAGLLSGAGGRSVSGALH
jgi:hypothetical protein